MREKEIDEIDVKVQVATCSKCGGVVLSSVKNPDGTLRKSSIKEFNKVTKYGCDIKTINLIVARTVRWCGWFNEAGKETCEGMWPKKEKEKK